jgi:hypothetical protein
VLRSSLRLAPFAGLWLLGAVLVVRTALVQTLPSPDEVHRLPPDSWVSVLTTLVLMLAEIAVVATLLLRRDEYRSPGRWVVAFGAMLAVTIVFALGAMHANNAMFLHVMWLGLTDVLLLAGAIVVAIAGAATRAGPDRPAE